MRCLEGRKRCSMVASSGDSRPWHHTGKDDDGDSEDDDPWSDSWDKKYASAHVDAQHSRRATSSIYTDQSCLHLVMPDRGSMEPKSQTGSLAPPNHYKECHHLDQFEGPIPHDMLFERSIGTRVKGALQLSSHGSVSSTALEPRLPPTVHLCSDWRAVLPSGRPPRNFWQQKGRHQLSLGNIFPYAPSAELYVPIKNVKSASIRSRYCLAIESPPYWTPTVTTPKDIYQRDRSIVLHDVELDQPTAATLSQRQSAVDSYKSGSHRRAAWIQALVGATIAFNCFGLHHAFGIFQQYYTMHYINSSLSTVSMIGSTQLVLILALSMPVAMFIPQNRLRLSCSAGTVVIALSILSTAWCTSVATLWLVQGFLTGLGMAIALASAITAMMTWFDNRAALIVLILATAGGYLGGIVYTLIIAHIVAHHELAMAMRVLAFVVLVAMVPAVLALRIQKRQYTFRIHAMQSEAGKPQFVARIIAALGFFLAFLGLHFLPTYITTMGSLLPRASTTQGRDLLLFMLTGGFCGCGLVASLFLRDFKVATTTMFSSILSGIVVLACARVEFTHFNLSIVSTLYGVVSSGLEMLCLAGPYISNICDRDTAYSRSNIWRDRLFKKRAIPCMSIAAFIGPPIAGALIKKADSVHASSAYQDAQIFAGVMLLVGGMLTLASKFLERRH